MFGHLIGRPCTKDTYTHTQAIQTRMHTVHTVHWNWKRFVIWTIKWDKIGFDLCLFSHSRSVILSLLLLSLDQSSESLFSIYFLSIFICLFVRWSFFFNDLIHTLNVCIYTLVVLMLDITWFQPLVKANGQINWNSFSPIVLDFIRCLFCCCLKRRKDWRNFGFFSHCFFFSTPWFTFLSMLLEVHYTLYYSKQGNFR